MMNDLATFVASEFFLRLENDIKKEALEKYRHMSFVRVTYVAYKKFEPFKRAKSLRTFLATSVGEGLMMWCGEDLVAVEELSISNCDEIRYMWESLRKLKVSYCDALVSFEEKVGEVLTSLRVLNVSPNSIEEFCQVL
ncbi:hypothetical protein L1987_03079 [Smallanthus sonchifolius]|uniref:Uncharacterized protein n=1 Tax=Smallanthus sonchifolius TaxID=185202 RepID=A0ACB9K9M0_9ASTR|nr:hypothetical protein L1987_03079 [Smallanthus sonchifolius]